ncbi:MAG: ComF family protein [Planctomycetota bacterium]|nr:ComF family protein [Planctomycetota bacterium]
MKSGSKRSRVMARWWLRQLSRLLETSLLPRVCPGCGGAARVAGTLCPACARMLEPVVAGAACPQCCGGLPCDDCARFRGPIGRVHAAFHYRGTAGGLVRRLKLEGDSGALGLLGRALARRFVRGDAAYRRFVVVPVPLARRRWRERGFNQAAALGTFVARRLSVPLKEHALTRVRETEPQGSALVNSRRRNVERAFAVRRVSKTCVLLVDDVMTSGATLRECARVLRRAGVHEVEAVVAATARR